MEPKQLVKSYIIRSFERKLLGHAMMDSKTTILKIRRMKKSIVVEDEDVYILDVI